MKKVISILLLICFTLSLLCVNVSAKEEKLNYLLLGDSIAEGFGFKNPSQSSYGKIVADTNGYNYINDALVARDSYEMIEQLQNDKKAIEDIKKADIISISIGSNDYLDNDDFVGLLLGAILKVNDDFLDEIAENYYDNLCLIIGTIKALNPDVVILMQNVYCAWTGFAERIFRAGADRVNKQIERYNSEHPGEIYISEIAPAMTGHPENLADDCVHPNAKGNVEIARLILAQLKDLGLGTQTEPVVNVPGEDYDYYCVFFGKVFGPVVTLFMKHITGNSVNI